MATKGSPLPSHLSAALRFTPSRLVWPDCRFGSFKSPPCCTHLKARDSRRPILLWARGDDSLWTLNSTSTSFPSNSSGSYNLTSSALEWLRLVAICRSETQKCNSKALVGCNDNTLQVWMLLPRESKNFAISSNTDVFKDKVRGETKEVRSLQCLVHTAGL